MSEYTWLLEKTNNKWLYCIPCETSIQYLSVHECHEDHEDNASLFKVNQRNEYTGLLYVSAWWRWPDGYPPWHTS